MSRFKRAFESPWASVVAGILVLVVAMSVVRLERFPEWDEAVFLSQSGGLNGIEVEPAVMVASREIGTPTLIGLIREVTDTLANTRLLWVVVSVVLLVTGAFLISRFVDAPAPLLIAGYGTYWLSVTFMASFYGYFVAATAALIAAGSYLGLRAEGRRQVLFGVGLGASLALTMWFRQVEGFLVTALILGHAVVVSPRSFWRLRVRGILSTIASGVVLFVVPWVIDTTIRFGSVGDRLSVGTSQDFERGLTSHLYDYWNVLIGHSFHYGNVGDPPGWANTVVAVMIVGVFIVGVVGLLLRDPETARVASDGVRIGAMSLLWILGIGLIAFFMFFIGTVRDRYLLIGLILLATVVLTGIWRLVGVYFDRVWAVALFAPLFLMWVIANLAVTDAYETGRFINGAEVQNVAHSIHVLASDRECIGYSRFGAPQLQFGSGCVTHLLTSPEEASRAASVARAPGRLVFLWWLRTEADALELDREVWTEIVRSPENDGRYLVAWAVDE